MRKIVAVLLAFACLITLFSCSDSEEIENSSKQEVEEIQNDEDGMFVVNTKTKKFHILSCTSARDISEEHRRLTSDITFLTDRGYSPCSKCILR